MTESISWYAFPSVRALVMESLICTVGSESADFSLSDEVQRDTQLWVVHPMRAVNVSSITAIRFFLSLLAIIVLLYIYAI